MHNTTWVLYIMQSFRKKITKQFQENFQTEEWTNLTHWTLLAMTGVESENKLIRRDSFK